MSWFGNWFGGGSETGGGSTCTGLAVPTLTVADNGDETVTVTIAGATAGTTNAVKYADTLGNVTWQSFGSRTGDGTIGPTAVEPGLYLWKVNSTKDGCNVVPDLILQRVAKDGIEMSRSTGDLEECLRYWLRTQPAIHALIDNRVYPDKVPQGAAWPRIIYELIGGQNVAHLTGCSFLAEARYQLTCCAKTKAEAKQLAKAIRGTEDNPALDRLQGYMGPHDARVYVQCAAVEDSRAVYVDLGDGSDQGEWQATLDVLIHYEETQ